MADPSQITVGCFKEIRGDEPGNPTFLNAPPATAHHRQASCGSSMTRVKEQRLAQINKRLMNVQKRKEKQQHNQPQPQNSQQEGTPPHNLSAQVLNVSNQAEYIAAETMGNGNILDTQNNLQLQEDDGKSWNESQRQLSTRKDDGLNPGQPDKAKLSMDYACKQISVGLGVAEGDGRSDVPGRHVDRALVQEYADRVHPWQLRDGQRVRYSMLESISNLGANEEGTGIGPDASAFLQMNKSYIKLFTILTILNIPVAILEHMNAKGRAFNPRTLELMRQCAHLATLLVLLIFNMVL